MYRRFNKSSKRKLYVLYFFTIIYVIFVFSLDLANPILYWGPLKIQALSQWYEFSIFKQNIKSKCPKKVHCERFIKILPK